MLTKGFILFNLKQHVLKYVPFILHNWDNIFFVYALSLRLMPHTITKNIFTFAIFFHIYNRFHIWRLPNGYKCENGHKCEKMLLQM